MSLPLHHFPGTIHAPIPEPNFAEKKQRSGVEPQRGAPILEDRGKAAMERAENNEQLMHAIRRRHS